MRKTTVELPDDLVRTLKLLAVEQDRSLKDVMIEQLRKGLASPDPQPARHRVDVPLIRGGKAAEPGRENTPDRIAELLAAGELDELAR